MTSRYLSPYGEVLRPAGLPSNPSVGLRISRDLIPGTRVKGNDREATEIVKMFSRDSQLHCHLA